jgi:hypothetical protein
LAASTKDHIVRQFNQQRGVVGVKIEAADKTEDLIKQAIKLGGEQGLVSGKRVVCIVKHEKSDDMDSVAGSVMFDL